MKDLTCSLPYLSRTWRDRECGPWTNLCGRSRNNMQVTLFVYLFIKCFDVCFHSPHSIESRVISKRNRSNSILCIFINFHSDYFFDDIYAFLRWIIKYCRCVAAPRWFSYFLETLFPPAAQVSRELHGPEHSQHLCRPHAPKEHQTRQNYHFPRPH